MGSSDGEGDEGGSGLTLAAVRDLIANAVTPLQTENQELRARALEADRVIAAQARKIEEARIGKESAATKTKPYCQYGSDGRGLDNPWPKRDVANEPELCKPHHFDISTDLHYLRCAGKFGNFRHEFARWRPSGATWTTSRAFSPRP